MASSKEAQDSLDELCFERLCLVPGKNRQLVRAEGRGARRLVHLSEPTSGLPGPPAAQPLLLGGPSADQQGPCD